MTDLRKLQLVELDLLLELDRICREHGITYYLVAGTLIGAVRHKGFIPWDDDLDVCMPQEDYKKFCEICKRDLDRKKYFLQTLDTDPHYLYIFAKLRREGTMYVRKGQEHLAYHHGICIDIFPICSVPRNALLNGIFEWTVKRCKTTMWAPIGAVSEKKPLLRFGYKILSKIPKHIPAKIIDAMTMRCTNEIRRVISAPSYARKKYIGARDPEIHTPPTIELEFEGYKFLAPENYDKQLRVYYGDYMQLPPQSERGGHHHATIIDFGDALDGILKEVM